MTDLARIGRKPKSTGESSIIRMDNFATDLARIGRKPCKSTMGKGDNL